MPQDFSKYITIHIKKTNNYTNEGKVADMLIFISSVNMQFSCLTLRHSKMQLSYVDPKVPSVCFRVLGFWFNNLGWGFGVKAGRVQ